MLDIFLPKFLPEKDVQRICARIAKGKPYTLHPSFSGNTGMIADYNRDKFCILPLDVLEWAINLGII